MRTPEVGQEVSMLHERQHDKREEREGGGGCGGREGRDGGS